jgi:hypothetical protein
VAAIPIIGDVIGKVLDRVLPDKAANDAAKAQLAQMSLSGELLQITGQLDIDKAEASSASPFTSGWRPFIGWICGVGLAVDFVVRPLVIWACSLCGRNVNFPSLDMTELMPLVLAMLGLAGAHAWENVQTNK